MKMLVLVSFGKDCDIKLDMDQLTTNDVGHKDVKNSFLDLFSSNQIGYNTFEVFH